MIHTHTKKSSYISKSEWDDDTKKLIVTFNDGTVYQYDDVTRDTWDGLIAASSIGQFFHRNIRGVHRNRPV